VIVADRLTIEAPEHEGRPSRPGARLALFAESVAVALSPLIGFFVLRMRAMSPVELPDPSMHTIYIVDPSQMFARYAAAFATTARMREGAQAGFLVLARLAYLAFGALPGFFATRYLFALVAVVPVYVLLRRLYGIPAGVLAIVVLLSCPVVITAWGTDYPDCAVVSYVVGAVACLAMPGRARMRPVWLSAAGVLLTLGVWSHGMGVVLATTTVVSYGAVRLVRARRQLWRDVALLGAVAVVTTLVLMVASRLVLGQLNFIAPTIAGAAFLNHPDQVREWHSSTWRWAPYDPYLLVPPSVVVAFALSFARRFHRVPSPQLFVGLVCAAQLAVFAFLQFAYHVQTLEMHYFSSTIWGVVCLALALTLAEIVRPLTDRPLSRWLPAIAVLAVPLAYEADPHVPAFVWLPGGVALAAVPALVAAVMWAWNRRGTAHSGRGGALGVAMAFATVAIAGSLLVLTVAPSLPLPHFRGLAGALDPATDYASALGGNATALIDWYEVSASLPAFVGDPTYKGEQLMMWAPPAEVGALIEPIGMFHAGFNLLSGFPVLSAAAATELARRHPAEILLVGNTAAGFQTALVALDTYEPVVVRKAVLRHGTAVLHAWLIVVQLFAPRGT
jgi:4-amino-4-deoxy-L-arabinose transferase-like glycosyltransferase